MSLNDDERALSKIWKFFNCSIALSTCIRREAIRLVSTSSQSLSCFPLRNGGIFNLTPNNAQCRSLCQPKQNPPFLKKSRRPHRQVSSLSEIEPGYKSDTKRPHQMVICLLNPYMYCDFYNLKMLIAVVLEERVVPQTPQLHR